MRVAVVWKWKRPKGRRTADEVARALERRFRPLLDTEPERRVHPGAEASFAAVELPAAGWRVPFHEEERDGAELAAWAFATEYPLNAPRLLGRPPTGGVLVALARALGDDPRPLVRELYPPFALFAGTGDELCVQVDGLGQGQLFEYEDERVWAVASRIAAFEALGVELELDPEPWPARFTLGWFPLDTSGWRRVRRVGPGERRVVDQRPGTPVRRTRADVVGEWVHPGAHTPDECLERARSSMVSYVRDFLPLVERPSVGLSGGWDSRAVASILRSEGADFELRVRGHPERFDVLVANELARVANLPLRIKTGGGYPPDDAEGCRRCMGKALAWQSGHMTTLKHKTFLALKPTLDGGVVNVMGQHSGIGKADFAVRIGAERLPSGDFEQALVTSLMQDAPPLYRDQARSLAVETILAAYRQADDHGLEGLQRLHYFFLQEYTRRWGSATVNAQAGVVLTPFLNPDFVRAAYAFPPERIPEKPFHRHVTATHAPDWADVIYENQASKRDVKEGRLPPTGIVLPDEEHAPAWRRGRHWGKYHHALYWRDVGGPLIEEALEARAGGVWWDPLFREERDLEAWSRPKGQPDALVLCHLAGEPSGI